MSTKIYIMTHKKCNKPSDDIYERLQVGSAINKDLGYLRDDSGDNISDLNPYFGELTGFYWLWKNVSDIDIVGTCHYRRYFGNNGHPISKLDCEEMLMYSDIICSNIVKTESENYRSEFLKSHNINDLLLVGDAIQNLYPEDFDAFVESLERNDHTYGNLCIMRKVIFDSYCEWMFNIFSWMMDKIDLEGYDAYHKRLFGFLSENLIRIFAKSRKLKVTSGKIYITEEKAETKELKSVVFHLLKEQRCSEARELFISFLKQRPDVMLPLSDITGELNALSEIINYIYITNDDEVFEHMESLDTLISYYRTNNLDKAK